MQAMILAAGKGTRMLPLTATTPKPLAIFNNKYLIEHVIINLKNAGINQIVINLHHLGDQIKQALGTGEYLGINIKYSEEATLLDTGGGVLQAINNNLLDNQKPFVVTSSDIITDFNFSSLFNKLTKLAHLVLVPNPSFKSHGDFSLNNNYLNLPNNNSTLNYTYGNIGIFNPKFFLDYSDKAFPMVNCIRQAIKAKQITAEVYDGSWRNIGTLEDLANYQ